MLRFFITRSETCEELVQKNEINDLKVLMPVAETIEIGLIESMISSSPVKIRLVQNQFPVSVWVSQLAIVASGTASLQTGLALKPSIIIYRVDCIIVLHISRIFT